MKNVAEVEQKTGFKPLVKNCRQVFGVTFFIVALLIYIYSFELIDVRLQAHIATGSMNAPLMGIFAIAGFAGFLMIGVAEFFLRLQNQLSN